MVFLRASDGKIKARITDALFREVLNTGAGHWRPHANPNPDQTNDAYIIDRPLVMNFDIVQLFIIEADYFVPGKA